MSDSGVSCKVCKKGTIISEAWEENAGLHRHSVSKNYCNTCGVSYEFVPLKKLKEPTPNQIMRTATLIVESIPIPDSVRRGQAENFKKGRQAAEDSKR